MLDQYFPSSSGVRVISEPGRFFVEASHTLCTEIIDKHDLEAQVDAFQDSVPTSLAGSRLLTPFRSPSQSSLSTPHHAVRPVVSNFSLENESNESNENNENTNRPSGSQRGATLTGEEEEPADQDQEEEEEAQLMLVDGPVGTKTAYESSLPAIDEMTTQSQLDSTPMPIHNLTSTIPSKQAPLLVMHRNLDVSPGGANGDMDGDEDGEGEGGDGETGEEERERERERVVVDVDGGCNEN